MSAAREMLGEIEVPCRCVSGAFDRETEWRIMYITRTGGLQIACCVLCVLEESRLPLTAG